MGFFVSSSGASNVEYFNADIDGADLANFSATATLDGFFYPEPIPVTLESNSFVFTMSAIMDAATPSATIHNAFFRAFSRDVNDQLVPIIFGNEIPVNWTLNAPFISVSFVCSPAVPSISVNGTATQQNSVTANTTAVMTELNAAFPAFDFNPANYTQTAANPIRMMLSTIVPSAITKNIVIVAGWTKGVNINPANEIISSRFSMVQM